ncbi:unnamed protein product [Symbiodinium sp. CCMP2592]|nr:unnamed protein product [Symbiodinium sp. CCMP2592]
MTQHDQQCFGLLVPCLAAQAICRGEQKHILMPFQCRQVAKGGTFFLLETKSEACSFPAVRQDEAYLYKVVAELTFVANRRLSDDQLVAMSSLGKCGIGSDKTALPRNLHELDALKTSLGIQEGSHKKFNIVWEVSVKSRYEPNLCVAQPPLHSTDDLAGGLKGDSGHADDAEGYAWLTFSRTLVPPPVRQDAASAASVPSGGDADSRVLVSHPSHASERSTRSTNTVDSIERDLHQLVHSTPGGDCEQPVATVAPTIADPTQGAATQVDLQGKEHEPDANAPLREEPVATCATVQKPEDNESEPASEPMPQAKVDHAEPEKHTEVMVKSMAESFLFEEDCYDTLHSEEGEDKVTRTYEAMADDSFSTAFSGIEAAGTAVNCLRQAWSKKTGLELPPIAASYQIEWNKDCISELLPHARLHGTCLFKNIAMFYRPELTETVQKGSGLGACDPEIVYTLAWVGLRLMLEDAEIISENVKTPGGAGLSSFARDGGQPVPSAAVTDAGLGNLLLRFLSPMYHLETTILDPSMLGDPFSREREFVKMYHKVKVLSRLSPISRFQKRFYRICAWSWKSFLALFFYCVYFMHEPVMRSKGVLGDDCQAELDWAQCRPTSRFKGFKGQGEDHDHADEQLKQQPLDVTCPSSWEMALNEMEYRFLQQYRRAWPDSAYQLNQDPMSGHGHPANELVFFTLIANFGLIWSDVARRWLMPTEALICQRFPVLPYIHDGVSLTSFNSKNKNRNARHVCSQVGNSMHVGVMALLQLHSFADVEVKSVPCLFRNIKHARQGSLN